MAVLKSICVYCGASAGSEAHKAAARALGAEMAKRGIRLVYGGGRIGIMGLIADAVLDAGGEVTGIIPDHLHDTEVGHTGATELIVTGSMHERKQAMFERSDAFVIMPGGLGTMEETFEVLTWKQLGLHDKAIVIANIDGYWQPFCDLVTSIIEKGYARPENARLFDVTDTVDGLFEILDAKPEPHKVDIADKI